MALTEKKRTTGRSLSTNNNVNVFGVDKKDQSLQSGLIHNVIIESYYCPEMKIALVSMAQFKGFDSQLNSVDVFGVTNF